MKKLLCSLILMLACSSYGQSIKANFFTTNIHSVALGITNNLVRTNDSRNLTLTGATNYFGGNVQVKTNVYVGGIVTASNQFNGAYGQLLKEDAEAIYLGTAPVNLTFYKTDGEFEINSSIILIPHLENLTTRLMAVGSGAGEGRVTALTIGSGLSLAGSTLSASGGTNVYYRNFSGVAVPPGLMVVGSGAGYVASLFAVSNQLSENYVFTVSDTGAVAANSYTGDGSALAGVVPISGLVKMTGALTNAVSIVVSNGGGGNVTINNDGTVVASTRLVSPAGAANALGVQIGTAGTGFYSPSAGYLRFAAGGVSQFELGNTPPYIALPSTGLIIFADGALGTGASVCLGSAGSGLAEINNGTAGTLRDLTLRSLIGKTDASSAAAGAVGQYVESKIAVGSAVSLTTATAADVTSISLTAGDWDVSGNINIAGATATYTQGVGSINTTSATLATDGSEVNSGAQFTLLSVTDGLTLSRKRVNVSSTTTVYLVAKATFSAGSMTAYGTINARRVR